MYAVILSKVQGGFKMAVINDSFTEAKVNTADIGTILRGVAAGTPLINASVQGTELKDDAGSFSRLETKRGVSPRIIVATYVSYAGRLLGYVIIDKNGKLSKVKKDSLYNVCEQAKARDVAYIQNGIYRVIDGVPQIACYPNRDFPEIRQPKPERSKSAGVTPDLSRSKTQVVENKETQKSPYTPEQLKELNEAKQRGVDINLIKDPKLSAKKMHLLWEASLDGTPIGYFNNPELSLEQMRFFTSLVKSKMFAEDCIPIIKKEYSVAQLGELLQGVASGLDISVYADSKLSAEDMYVQRAAQECKTYDTLFLSDGTDIAVYASKYLKTLEKHKK